MRPPKGCRPGVSQRRAARTGRAGMRPRAPDSTPQSLRYGFERKVNDLRDRERGQGGNRNSQSDGNSTWCLRSTATHINNSAPPSRMTIRAGRISRKAPTLVEIAAIVGAGLVVHAMARGPPRPPILREYVWVRGMQEAGPDYVARLQQLENSSELCAAEVVYERRCREAAKTCGPEALAGCALLGLVGLACAYDVYRDCQKPRPSLECSHERD